MLGGPECCCSMALNFFEESNGPKESFSVISCAYNTSKGAYSSQTRFIVNFRLKSAEFMLRIPPKWPFFDPICGFGCVRWVHIWSDRAEIFFGDLERSKQYS